MTDTRLTRCLLGALILIISYVAVLPGAEAETDRVGTIPDEISADFGSVSELTDAMGLGAEVIDATFTGDNRGASVETASVGGFPIVGGSYLVLSTGQAADLTEPDEEPNRSTILGGPVGAAGQDQTQLAIRMNRPAGATCFSFDFSFLSEEFPEFIGSQFNDAFTAEIIESDITFGDGSIVTPWNFAFDAEGNAITINSVVGLAEDDDSTFDGTTPVLTAITPAELNDDGEILVTFTIQDVGDSIYDSAVLIDNARWLFGPDCEAGIIPDADGDALPDDWETNGLDVDGDGDIDLDLPALGADPQRKDIFLEIDWMFEEETCVWLICWGGEDFSPRQVAIDQMVAAFANAPVPNPDGTTGITLHVDAGALGGGNAVPHSDDLGASVGNQYDWSDFQAIKDDNFDDDRRDVFHYAIYADQYGGGTSSGISRGIKAADFIVSQGAFNGGSGFTLVQERGTLMHEFGHNLNLLHGGDENENGKPNYLSIMSYQFQLAGVPGGANNGLDYSRDALNSLDENALDETVGLDPDGVLAGFGTSWTCPDGSDDDVANAAGAIDWNCDGDATDAGVTVDLNNNPDYSNSGLTVLAGFDDWDNLRFDGGAIGQLGISEPPPVTTPDIELTRDLAEELGLLTGDYDATLVAHANTVLLAGTGIRTIPVTLANVGKVDDTYTLAVDDSGLGVDDGGSTAVAAGAEATPLTVDTTGLTPGTYQVAIVAASAGLGAAVDETVIEVIVPDLSDPSDAEQALEDLQDLPDGEGPVNKDDLIDALMEALDDGGPVDTLELTFVEIDNATRAGLGFDLFGEFVGGKAPYSVEIDWGNGASCPGAGSCNTFSSASGPSTITATYRYPVTGVYDVTVKITDAQGTMVTKTVQTASCTIVGTGRSESLVGTNGDDVICGLGGNDRIDGRGGNDIIFGGSGRDLIKGGDGLDQIFGGRGNDRLLGEAGDDYISGGNGNDQQFGGDGDDVLFGQKGRDVQLGQAGDDQLLGSRGNDVLLGGDGADVLIGTRGNDRLVGGPGPDVLDGGSGRDNLIGSAGDDELSGGDDDDRLKGGSGDDDLDGGDGVDRCNGNGGVNTAVNCEL